MRGKAPGPRYGDDGCGGGGTLYRGGLAGIMCGEAWLVWALFVSNGSLCVWRREEDDENGLTIPSGIQHVVVVFRAGDGGFNVLTFGFTY